MNFVKLYIGDYQRDTGHLSIAEHGAYMLMLQHYYATERPLPVGKSLHRLLRAETRTEREAIDSVVRQFWSERDGGLVNGRADEEIGKADHQRTVNREVGKRGGRPRKTEPDTETETESDTESAAEPEPNRNPNQTPDTRQIKNKPSPPDGVASARPTNGQDRQAELWANALGMLRGQGASETSARSFVGLQLRDYEADDVADAFASAAGAANVRAYVREVLKTKPRRAEKPADVVYRHGQATIGGFVA
jgi:uncharacterized protein YdaU (DUF1376 family)